MFVDHPITIIAVVLIVVKVIKVLAGLFGKEKRRFRLFSAGGVVSSHSALVVSAATISFCLEGISSSSFAIAASVSLIVMYDAAGLRAEVGKHAEWINRLNPSAKLRISTGHNMKEVVLGAVLGMSLTLLLLFYDF